MYPLKLNICSKLLRTAAVCVFMVVAFTPASQAQTLPVTTSFSVAVEDAALLSTSARFEMTDGTSLAQALQAGGIVPVQVKIEDVFATTVLYDNTIFVSTTGGLGNVVFGTPSTGELTMNANQGEVTFDFLLDIGPLVSGDTKLKVYYRASYVGLLGRARRYVHEADTEIYARAFDGSF